LPEDDTFLCVPLELSIERRRATPAGEKRRRNWQTDSRFERPRLVPWMDADGVMHRPCTTRSATWLDAACHAGRSHAIRRKDGAGLDPFRLAEGKGKSGARRTESVHGVPGSASCPLGVAVSFNSGRAAASIAFV